MLVGEVANYEVTHLVSSFLNLNMFRAPIDPHAP